MQVLNLKLQNFRNYDNIDLNFSQSTNLIYGKNGMGKTNLVEAIYVLSLTKSFKTNNDRILIKNGEDYLKISAQVQDSLKKDYQIIISKDGKRIKENNTIIKKISDYISKINVIIFSPYDLNVIKDSPSERRKMLNVSISKLDNTYLKTLNSYNKTIKQRNAYLKTIYLNNIKNDGYLDIITDKLISYGKLLYDYRKKYIDDINSLITDKFNYINHINDVKIKYISDYNDLSEDKIKKKYLLLREKEKILGKTLFGVHHDNFCFVVNNHDFRDYASEGQQKNVIIAYKLSEIELLYKKHRDYPILILDDLFSELDKEKINNILKLLDKNIQTFITTTELDVVSEDIINNSAVFHIIDGKVKEDRK